MVRVQGPVVEALAISFQSDWYVEHSLSDGKLPDHTTHTQLAKRGASAAQVLPSGPTNQVQAIEQLVLLAIYCARQEVIITTLFCSERSTRDGPYLRRPTRCQSDCDRPGQSRLVTRAIGKPRIQRGFAIGRVHIAQFQGGLLHTKSIVIDQRFSFFGSLNMDPRSFRLNFELTLAVYDPFFPKSSAAFSNPT